jgi:hypothetical protein
MKQRKSIIVRIAAFSVAATFVAFTVSPARADTFAQYTQVDGSTQQWTFSVLNGVSSVSASGTVNFSMSNVPGAPVGPVVANFVLSATSTTGGTTTGNAYSEPGFSGTFSFTDPSLASGKQDLLSGIFQFESTGAQLNESIGGTGGGFGASDTAIDLNEVVMTSSYIDFVGGTLQTSTFTMSSLAPSFTAGGNPDMPTNGPYTAAGVGTFSSSIVFTPEPSTSLLIAGGLIGVGLLGRKKASRRV